MRVELLLCGTNGASEDCKAKLTRLGAPVASFIHAYVKTPKGDVFSPFQGPYDFRSPFHAFVDDFFSFPDAKTRSCLNLSFDLQDSVTDLPYPHIYEIFSTGNGECIGSSSFVQFGFISLFLLALTRR